MGASPDLRPLELRQEDRDLNVADSFTCAFLLPIQPLVIVFFHGGHTRLVKSNNAGDFIQHSPFSNFCVADSEL